MASAALICACVPVTVTVVVPLPPTVAPPALLAFKTPLVTVSVALVRLLSASATLMVEPPVKASVPSSATVCVPAPGTVLTGGSFTLVTVTLTVAVSDRRPDSSPCR